MVLANCQADDQKEDLGEGNIPPHNIVLHEIKPVDLISLISSQLESLSDGPEAFEPGEYQKYNLRAKIEVENDDLIEKPCGDASVHYLVGLLLGIIQLIESDLNVSSD